MKFTPEDGALRVTLRRVTNTIELVVADSGQGIPREFLPSMFEPFRQADGSTTRPQFEAVVNLGRVSVQARA